MNEFAALSHWQAFSSGLVKVHLGEAESALSMHYDFGDAGGFVVARRLYSLQLPERFRFRLRLRGIGWPNRFELKLVDPSGENVWWFRRPAVIWAADWEEWVIESRDFEFAWGPAGGGPPSAIAAVEVAIVAEAGGAGTLSLADLQLEDLSARERCVITASSTQAGYSTDLAHGRWRSGEACAWLLLDLQEVRTLSALSIRWELDCQAQRFAVEISDDGVRWETIYNAEHVGGSCSDLFFGNRQARWVRLQLLSAANQQFFGVVGLDVIPVERARSLVEFLHDVAQREPRGFFPKYLQRQQSYWTVFGAPTCPFQGLINEEGMVEVHRAGFSLEPFLRCDDQWLSWADATHIQSLQAGYLPVPTVQRQHLRALMSVSGCAALINNVWSIWLCYQVSHTGEQARRFRLAVVARPFQVVPPWQAYREFGGVHPIHEVDVRERFVRINQDQVLIPQAAAHCSARGWLQPSMLLASACTGIHPSSVQEGSGLAQAELNWDFELNPGETKTVYVVVPFPHLTDADAEQCALTASTLSGADIFAHASAAWKQVLDRQGLQLPASAQDFIDTWKTSTAHILLNRDGPALQPGPRRYARSWIRDGATMCAALLRTGNHRAVREFLLWYVGFLREDGYVPCCVDREGIDELVEHDSHGQWMHVVMEYYRFSGDRPFVLRLLDSVIRAGQFLMSLRATRCTPEYDADAKVARRGLIPESVSHEGYLAQAVHSYWDSFWALRGFADAAELCQVLENKVWAETFAREENALRDAVRASIACVIGQRGIPHIPGSVEWADSDPTASACAVGQLGEAACFPAEALRYTFDSFMQHWRTRMYAAETRTKYSAYDIRVIYALVKLGRREDAYEIARFYLADRRPHAWNQWPEITWPDPDSPGHLGDLPHSWIGAEYVLAFRSLFVDESAGELVIGRGLPAEWLVQGVSMTQWPTAFGVIDLQVSLRASDEITLILQGDVVPPAGINIQLPLATDILQVETDRSNLLETLPRTLRLHHSPATLTICLHSRSLA